MPDTNRTPKGPFIKFAAVDITIAFAALALAFFIRFQELRYENITIYLQLMAPILIIRIAALYMFRMYDFSRGFTSFDVIYFSGCAIAVAHSIEFAAISYTEIFHETNGTIEVVTHTPNPYEQVFREVFPRTNQSSPILLSPNETFQISRYILILNFLLSWVGAAGWRVLYLKRRRKWAYDETRMLIVGTGKLAESVHRDLEQYSRLGHKVVGLIDDDVEDAPDDAPVLGKMENLIHIVNQHDIDEIIVTSQKANRNELLQIISACQATGCKVRLLPEMYEVTIGKVEVGQVAGIPLITMNAEPLSEWGFFVKRIFDITVSSCMLILFSPLMFIIAIAIRRDSKGPAFYRQERVGKHGNHFIINKFRTMKIDAEEQGPTLATEDDPRATNFGQFLRRWHLDELPQLINVLKGDMSLVGPRPERPHFVEQFEKEIPAYRLRLRIRPGITGLGQIHGFYHSPIEHKLRYDLAYINNISFLLDLKILILTLRVTVLEHKIPTNKS